MASGHPGVDEPKFPLVQLRRPALDAGLGFPSERHSPIRRGWSMLNGMTGLPRRSRAKSWSRRGSEKGTSWLSRRAIRNGATCGTNGFRGAKRKVSQAPCQARGDEWWLGLAACTHPSPLLPPPPLHAPAGVHVELVQAPGAPGEAGDGDDHDGEDGEGERVSGEQGTDPANARKCCGAVRPESDLVAGAAVRNYLHYEYKCHVVAVAMIGAFRDRAMTRRNSAARPPRLPSSRTPPKGRPPHRMER